MVIDPLHPNTLYADSLRSTDGGKSWASLYTANTYRLLAIAPGTGTLYVGGQGVYELQLVGEPPRQIMATLENPANRQLVSGVGMISGWAFPTRENAFFYSPTVFIDGERVEQISLSAPCCSEREDVRAAFPQFSAEGTKNSGWGTVWNWGDLRSGVHTIQLVLTSEEGVLIPPRHIVTVVKPGDSEFLDRFDLTGASTSIASEELLVDGIVIRDKGTQQQKHINARFRWFTNSQSFGMARTETLSQLSSARSLPSAWGAAFYARLKNLPSLIPSAQAAGGIISNFESPQAEQVVSGISIIHGWAFAPGASPIPFHDQSLASVGLFLDGAFHSPVPCCAHRPDVASAYPVRGALESGWGLLFNYGDVNPGAHSLGIEILGRDGSMQLLQRTVRVVQIGGFPFVDRFALSQATAHIEGEEIVLSGVRVRDKASQQTKTTTVRLRWFEHSQSLGIVASSS